MKKILIIEDEPDVIEVMRGLLQGKPYEVDAALGGEEGINKIKKQKPDLILLDIRMPNVSGRAILDLMKREKINIPVIVVTAVAATMEVRNELESKYNIAGFINKAYLQESLVSEIKRVLGKK